MRNPKQIINANMANERVINVQWYGADPTGSEDSSEAINNAIAAAKTLAYTDAHSGGYNSLIKYMTIKLFIPPGKYLLNSSIDMTGINHGGTAWGVEATGAVFLANMTGKVVFDLTGSIACIWKGGNIQGSDVNMPTCGILVGRDSGGLSAGNHHFEDVDITGSFSVTCMYNIASEALYVERCKFQNFYDSADAYCMIQDGDGAFIDRITSDFTNPGQLQFNIVNDSFRLQYGSESMMYTSTATYPLTNGTIDSGRSTNIWNNVYATTYYSGALAGVTGSFTSNDGKTITVTGGIITGIV